MNTTLCALFIFMLLVSMIGLIVSIVYYVIETKKNEKDQDPNVVRDSKIGIIVTSVLLFVSSVLYLIYSRKTKPSEKSEKHPVTPIRPIANRLGYDTESENATPVTQNTTPVTQNTTPDTQNTTPDTQNALSEPLLKRNIPKLNKKYLGEDFKGLPIKLPISKNKK